MSYMLIVAWLQVTNGTAPVSAVFKKNGEYKHAGSVVAESKCWSMLKGGLTVDESGPAELYFEVSIICTNICVIVCFLFSFPHFDGSCFGGYV